MGRSPTGVSTTTNFIWNDLTTDKITGQTTSYKALKSHISSVFSLLLVKQLQERLICERRLSVSNKASHFLFELF